MLNAIGRNGRERALDLLDPRCTLPFDGICNRRDRLRDIDPNRRLGRHTTHMYHRYQPALSLRLAMGAKDYHYSVRHHGHDVSRLGRLSMLEWWMIVRYHSRQDDYRKRASHYRQIAHQKASPKNSSLLCRIPFRPFVVIVKASQPARPNTAASQRRKHAAISGDELSTRQL